MSLGGPQRGPGHFGEEEKNFLPPQGFDIRVVQPTVYSLRVYRLRCSDRKNVFGVLDVTLAPRTYSP